MSSRILLISDIHANYPALEAVAHHVQGEKIDLIINGGDCIVYAPFPNETIGWLRDHKAVSILGNTDIKTLQVIAGKKLRKPRKKDKRIMYNWTAKQLTKKNKKYLAEIPQRKILELEGFRIGLYHGSPADDNEHLFADTPTKRFKELTRETDCNIVIVGHSHTPFHKVVNNIHFINPGSVGRMFDGNPAASFATLKIESEKIDVSFFRCSYDIQKVIQKIRKHKLPPIYEEMYLQGRKLN